MPEFQNQHEVGPRDTEPVEYQPESLGLPDYIGLGSILMLAGLALRLLWWRR